LNAVASNVRVSYHLHHATDDVTHLKALRFIALLEILKGGVVVIGALALLHFVHRDIAAIAAALLDRLHVPPGASLATYILQGADSVTPAKIKGLIGFATIYSTIRFVEGYGLWLARIWAEWFAIISGTVYLPFEVYELIQKVTWIHVGVLLANVAIVVYMASLRVRAKHLTAPAHNRDLRDAA
jgi:uncharacterized membrane protein (DUF2068 family)